MSGSWIKKDKRLAIYLRDGATCCYCGCAVQIGAHVSEPGAATLDHLRPRERGGDNSHTNLVTSCVGCNSSKQDSTMADWLKALASRGIDAAEVRKEISRRKARKLDNYRKSAKAILAGDLD
jgi:5-methylcytosine-specific restriction endonuclease McrA